MPARLSHRFRLSRAARRLKSRVFSESGGSQLVEFAVSLPLLVFLTVGIFDFGSAYTVKEKLAGMAQEAARIGAAQPEGDLSYTSGDCTQLVAVCAVRDVVDHHLVSAHMDDCGLSGAAPAYAGNLTWTFTTQGGCPANLVLTINRGFTSTTNLANPFNTGRYTIEMTKVTLSYSYRWQFGKVVGLVSPGSTFAGVSQITSTAVMQNLY